MGLRADSARPQRVSGSARRVKWGKASLPFSWLRGGENMTIELFINFDSESLIFCEQIRGKIKGTKFSQNSLK